MITQKLIALDACERAIEWAQGKSWQKIYTTCHRGDWLLWLFARTNPEDLQLLTLAKGHCANTVRHLMKDERSIKAVDTAIAFGEGRATQQELDAAADAYADAAYAADADADAAYAAYAAVAAAYAADAAVAAAVAAYAADAAYTASAASAASAYYANQKLTADICRKYLPIEVWRMEEDCE